MPSLFPSFPSSPGFTASAAGGGSRGRWSAKESFLVALLAIIAVCCILVVAELGSVISFQSQQGVAPPIVINTDGSGSGSGSSSFTATDTSVGSSNVQSLGGYNKCANKKIDLPNVECVVDAMTNVGPQAGANVTKGYQGNMNVDYTPITTEYWKNAMCPVNVHWHLGAEHLSVGEYDETGKGPAVDADPENRQGFMCTKYDENDSKFTKPYDWKHCVGMQVGATYEVHWPHSAAGACGTPDQYQTPFYDGVFCNLDEATLGTLQAQDIANSVGVHAQIFTVVNDESYFYPNMMRGMIVDGDMGKDVAKYTGSTTGDKRNNEICSQYTPVTWQVDRKCHLISASSFDQMCAEMKMQRDDMTDDLHAHGSRELVADDLAANNHQNRNRKLRAHFP